MKQKCAIVGTVNKVNPEKYVVVYESKTLPLENGSRIPDIDILFTNIPLQAFSTASKDKKVTTNPFAEIMAIVKDKRPKMLILENVSGMPLYRGGQTYKEMCDILNGAGYEVSQEHDVRSGRFYVRAKRTY